jgi:hypothetical protein
MLPKVTPLIVLPPAHKFQDLDRNKLFGFEIACFARFWLVCSFSVSLLSFSSLLSHSLSLPSVHSLHRHMYKATTGQFSQNFEGAIGIDLGTTYSECSKMLLYESFLTIRATEQHRLTLRSRIERLIGDAAKNQVTMDPNKQYLMQRD